jgi:hypothetical protein
VHHQRFPEDTTCDRLTFISKSRPMNDLTWMPSAAQKWSTKMGTVPSLAADCCHVVTRWALPDSPKSTTRYTSQKVRLNLIRRTGQGE